MFMTVAAPANTNKEANAIRGIRWTLKRDNIVKEESDTSISVYRAFPVGKSHFPSNGNDCRSNKIKSLYDQDAPADFKDRSDEWWVRGAGFTSLRRASPFSAFQNNV